MGRRASALGSARTGSKRKVAGSRRKEAGSRMQEAGSKGAGHILEEGEECSVVL